MRSTRILLLVFLSYVSAAKGLDLEVVTYNTGLRQLESDALAPCRDARRKGQPAAVAEILQPPFILHLQGVWTDDAYDLYAKLAQDRGWSITGKKDLKDRGAVILTSGRIRWEKFHAFSCDAPIAKDFEPVRGLQEANILIPSETEDGFRVRTFNAHTIESEGEKWDPCHQSQLSEAAMMTFNVQELSIPAGEFSSGPDLEDAIWTPFYTSILQSGFAWLSSAEPSTAHIFAKVDEGSSHFRLDKGASVVLDQEADVGPCEGEDPVSWSDHSGLSAIIELLEP